ncbi:MAG: hypothetical protein ACO36I_21450 [Candidatus Latescibacterota bacterium]
MNWLFLGIAIGAIIYLAMVIIGFLEDHRESREKIEQTEIDIKRLELQFSESEKARNEAENRTAKLEEEALKYEQDISELHTKINSSMPAKHKDGET